MIFKSFRIGFAFTGGNILAHRVFPEFERLVGEEAEVIPIVAVKDGEQSGEVGESLAIKASLLSGQSVIQTMEEARNFCKTNKPLDVMVIAPCTEVEIGKLAAGVCDTPELWLTMEQLRYDRPVVLGITVNNGFGLDAKNIGLLLATKNIYFVPFREDRIGVLVARFNLMAATIMEALQGVQLQPVIDR